MEFIVLLWLLLFLFGAGAGTLFAIPAALRLIDPVRLRRTARLWPLLAASGALSVFLARGPVAVTLASLYAAGALAVAVRAPVGLLRILPRIVHVGGPRPASVEIAALAAQVVPALAAASLVVERTGYRLFGIHPDDLLLLVWHLHFVAFASALVAGLAYRATSTGVLARCAAYSVPLGFPLAVLGYLTDAWTGLAGAVVLAVGLWAAAFLSRRELRQQGTGLIAGIALSFAALIALWWAAETTDDSFVVTSGPTGIVVLGMGLAAAACVFGFFLTVASARRRLADDRAARTDQADRAHGTAPAGRTGPAARTETPA
ncbi:YndJ family transporter [Streptomyces sp. NPDC054956]